MLLTACSGGEKRRDEAVHSVYYWSTTFDMDSTKQAFVRQHEVRRIYLRYFDVVLGEHGEAQPNATVRFASAVPKGVEIVPTVFIVNDVMRKDIEGLAEKILGRVVQMSETNDVAGVKEMQIDCDWTLSTRRRFFDFMREMQRLCHERDMKLSATIRFHQLSQPSPPCDRGVLMAYNTGDFTRLDCEKPILDLADVKQYLRHLGSYDLPLAVAYPVYSWRLLFRGGEYVGIMHSDDDLPVLPTDTIVTRQPSYEDIIAAQKAINGKIKHNEREVILFDLSRQNINHYNTTEYETIFNP